MPIIETLPTCAICQTDVEVPHLACTTTCNHTFHQNCYLQALGARTSDPFLCPYCRQAHSFMIPSEDGTTIQTVHLNGQTPVITPAVPAQQYVPQPVRPSRVRPVVDPAHRCTGTYKNGRPCQRRKSNIPGAVLCGPCIGRQLSVGTDSDHEVIQQQNKAAGSIVSYKRKAEDRLSKEMDKTIKIESDMQEAMRLEADNRRRATSVRAKYQNVQQMLQFIMSPSSQLPQLPPAPQALLGLPAPPDQTQG